MFRPYYSSCQTIAKLVINHVNKRFPLAAQVVLQSTSSKLSNYSEHIKGDITNKLEFIHPENHTPIPIYQVLDFEGNIKDKSQKPNLTDEHLIKMYETMTLLSTMDYILYKAQSQGRISFYITNFGEEGIHIGSAAAFNPKDLIYGQYREAGVLMYRGFTLQQFTDQCFGNIGSSCKGIQMPVHYGSPELHFVTISSTMATQMPQAVGSAYAYKRAQNGLCVICYFGDGTASEGDAHAAFNFAATLDVPLIFICRNNGFAISTPARDQYRGDGIAARGVGYGMATIRVDGNDVFAVYNAAKAARELALDQMRPVLIEAMTLRVGHHSTSDDSSVYRSIDEVNIFDKKFNPITRLRKYLLKHGCWNNENEEQWKIKAEKMIKEAFQKSESMKRASLSTMFEHIFDRTEPHLQRQMNEMYSHVRQYSDHYPLSLHEHSTK